MSRYGTQPVQPQHRDRELRQFDTAPAGDRLRLDEDQARAALALKRPSHL